MSAAWKHAARAALACAFLLPALAFGDPQPADKHSHLVGRDGKTLRDDEFAKMVSSLLLKDGKANAKDAKFLFQQCFGGGMLDDLDKAFGDKLSWIGGSASAHDQVSFGAPDEFKQDTWTHALLTGIRVKDPRRTLASHLAQARKDDTASVARAKPVTAINPKTGKPYPPEDPQTMTRNGGEKITVDDASAKSHHAIIWTGKAEPRHNADAAGMKDALEKQWGTNTPGTSLRFVGTTAELQRAIDNLKTLMNPDEQFFFYSTDHGSLVSTMLDTPIRVGGKTNDIEGLSLSEGELGGMHWDSDNVPQLTVQYSGLADFIPVSFNGMLLGQLDPGLNEMVFDVDESFVSLVNSVSIDNTTDQAFTLSGKYFTGGAITTILAVPEPSTGWLLLLGLAAFALYRRRTPR